MIFIIPYLYKMQNLKHLINSKYAILDSSVKNHPVIETHFTEAFTILAKIKAMLECFMIKIAHY